MLRIRPSGRLVPNVHAWLQLPSATGFIVAADLGTVLVMHVRMNAFQVPRGHQCSHMLGRGHETVCWSPPCKELF